MVSPTLAELGDGALTVGLDVGKEEVFVVVRDGSGRFTRPWKAKQPTEIHELTQRLCQIAAERPVIVAREATGTYGDALRQAMTDAKLEVHRVSAKASSDYSEVFDGVPSTHDGKAAAIVAEVAAFGKSTAWPWREKPAREAETARWVNWIDSQQDMYKAWQGRLVGEARFSATRRFRPY